MYWGKLFFSRRVCGDRVYCSICRLWEPVLVEISDLYVLLDPTSTYSTRIIVLCACVKLSYLLTLNLSDCTAN